MRAVIRGTGMCVPPTIVDNERMALLMDTSDEWIQQRTGIAARRFADPDTATSDLAVPAAEQALLGAGMEKEEIDYVIFATMTPDTYLPGSGPIFQRKLGLGTVPCLDIRQQCAGFLYGLQLADAVIRSGQYRNVLLVGAEVHSSLFPWDYWRRFLFEPGFRISREEYEKNTLLRDRAVLFGDGAGAFVVTRSEGGEAGIEDVLMRSDGELAGVICVKAGGSAYRPYFHPAMFESGDTAPIVQGREVFRTAVTLMPEAVEEILGRNGFTLDDLDLLIVHQANLRINEAVQKRLGLPGEKTFNNIQKYGNTTAATLPIAFHEARLERDLPPGSLVCFVALGSGLHWGAALYRC